MDSDIAANEQLSILEQQLDAAWYADDEQRMAELRRDIDQLQPSTYVEVLGANLKFYQAFSRGSVVDVASCWLQSKDVMCKHPLGPMFVGFWDVTSSFESLFRAGISDIRPDNVRISVRGSVALVTCDEFATPPDNEQSNDSSSVATKFNTNFSPEPAQIRMTAINIYEKSSGQFQLIYHMSSPVTPLMD